MIPVAVSYRNAKGGGKKGGKQGNKGGAQPDAGELNKFIKANFPTKDGKINIKLTSEKSDMGALKAYTKSMVDHMLMHYETFVESSKSAGSSGYSLDIMNLIHYHVMGDYRVVFKDGSLQYEYSTLENFGGSDYRKEDVQLHKILAQTVTPDSVYGVNSTRAPVPWMSKEINQGSSGIRLMLPSIGTQVVSTFAYDTNIDEFQKMVINLCEFLNTKITSQEDLAEQVTLPDRVDASGISHPRDPEGKRPIVAVLIEALRANLDITAAQVNEVISSLDRAIAAKDGSANILEYFLKEVIVDTTSRFVQGDIVSISNLGDLTQLEQDTIQDRIGDTDDIREESMNVIGVTTERDQNGNANYYYRLEGEFDDSIVAAKVRESYLKPVREGQRDIKKKNKKFVEPPRGEKLILYRTIVDILASVQAYLSTMNKDLVVMYLSQGLHPSTKASYIAGTELPNLRPPFHGRNFDANPARYFGTGNKPKVKAKDSFLYRLISLRNTYAQLALSAQRNSPAVFDKKLFDDFYKDDLRLKEVTWLAYALSEEGKVLVEKPRQEDPMAVLMYRRPGSDQGVTATAPADLRTAFYRIDAPMIKEVYLIYLQAFNDFTLSVAYSVESASAEPKAGKIAKAVWGQIKRRTANIFNSGVVPYQFFGKVFAEVKRALSQQRTSVEPYPPSWASTNLVSQLSQNPLELGIQVTPETYQSSLNDYMDFLMGRYGGNPKVASAVLTAIESYTISTATDYTELREQFIERIKDNQKNSKLKSTNAVSSKPILLFSTS